MKRMLLAILCLGTVTGGWAEPPAAEPASDAPGGAALAPMRMLHIRAQGLPAREVAEQIREQAGVDIDIPEHLADVEVTLFFLHSDVDAVVGALARRLFCRVHRPTERTFLLEEIERVTITTEGALRDIREVIEAIVRDAQVNRRARPDGTVAPVQVSVSHEVTGQVAVNFQDVPWTEALREAVLTAGAYSVVEGNYGILRVVPTARLRAQMETRVIRLRYLRPPPPWQGFMNPEYASTVAERLEARGIRAGGSSGEGDISRIDPESFALLRALQAALDQGDGDERLPGESIEYDQQTNALIVRATPAKLAEIEAIIKALDVEPQQIFVEVKMVATTDTDFLDFGTDWGGAQNTGPVASMALGSAFHRLPFNMGYGGFEGSPEIIQNSPTSQDVDNFLRHRVSEDFPHAYEYGLMDFTQVQAVLRFVKRDVRSRVVEKPMLAARDGFPATIFVGDEIRYAETTATSSQQGTLEFSINEASGSPVRTGLQLLVTPLIVRDRDQINLNIVLSSDSLSGTSTTQPGFNSFSNGTQTIDLPQVSSRSIVTEALLESNQTVVLGGMIQDRESDEITKLPILGDLPLIGYFFKNKNRNRTEENVMIFITPRIVRSVGETTGSFDEFMDRRADEERERFRERIQDEPPREEGGSGEE